MHTFPKSISEKEALRLVTRLCERRGVRLDVRGDEEGWWLETEGGSIEAILDSSLRGVCEESREDIRSAGRSAGDWFVSVLERADDRSATEMLRGAEREAEAAWAEAVNRVEEARRLLNAWVLAVEACGVASHPKRVEEAAEECYMSIALGRRRAAAGERPAEDWITELADALPLLANPMGRRARDLAVDVREAYDRASYAAGAWDRATRHFAYPKAVPFDLEPAPIPLTLPDPFDVVKPLIEAMNEDAKEMAVGEPGTKHREMAEALEGAELASLFRVLQDADSLLQLARRLNSELRVDSEVSTKRGMRPGPKVQPPYHRVGDWIEAVARLIGANPVWGRSTIQQRLESGGKAENKLSQRP